MGCCQSDLAQLQEEPLEEAIIRLSESNLWFSNKKLVDLFLTIKEITFELNISNIDKLCLLLSIPLQSQSWKFLMRLAKKDLLTKDNLIGIVTLLSKSKIIGLKTAMLFSNEKNEFISRIQSLLNIAIWVLPLNLELHDSSVCEYLEKLQFASEVLIKHLIYLTVDDIHKRLNLLNLKSAHHLRLKLFNEYKKFKVYGKSQKFKEIRIFCWKPLSLPVNNPEFYDEN